MANKEKPGNISKRMQRRAEERRKRNKNLLIVGGVVVVLLIALGAAIIWGGPSEATQTAMPLDVDINEAYQMVEEGAFLLDVRTQAEWDEFHASQATLIPLDQLAARASEIPKDRDVVVICRSGNRSQEGRDILLQAGFENVTSANGGMNEWRAAGYPTE